jgi:hypothetical protein
MRRLTEDQLHVLGVVAKHERVCIGLPVSAEWAPIAAMLRQLAKWHFLHEEATDDGPAYSLTQAGFERLPD